MCFSVRASAPAPGMQSFSSQFLHYCWCCVALICVWIWIAHSLVFSIVLPVMIIIMSTFLTFCVMPSSDLSGFNSQANTSGQHVHTFLTAPGSKVNQFATWCSFLSSPFLIAQRLTAPNRIVEVTWGKVTGVSSHWRCCRFTLIYRGGLGGNSSAELLYQSQTSWE